MRLPRVTARSVGALLLGVMVAALIGTGLAKAQVETGLESFLPGDDPQAQTYQRTVAEFGGDPVVVLLESADRSEILSQERLPELLRLEGRLSGLDKVSGVYGPATLLNQVAGQAQDLMAQLIGRRDVEINTAQEKARAAGESAEKVREAGEAAEAKFDARYGALVVTAMPGGLPTMTNQGFVDQVVFSDQGKVRAQWRFLVPNEHAVAILVRPSENTSAQDAGTLTEAVRSLVDEADLDGVEVSVTGVPVLVSAISDQAVSEVPRLAVLAVLGVGLSLFLATWLRRSRRLVPLATTAVAVAGSVSFLGWIDRPVSLGVLAFCSVLLGMGCYYPTYFAMGARVRTVAVVALASAASLSTLMLSPLPLIQDLGLTLAVGICLAAGLGWLLRHWLISSTQEGAEGPDAISAAHPAKPSTVSRSAARWVAGVATFVAAIGWILLPSLQLETDIEQFAGGLTEYEAAMHVQSVMGSSGEVALVVRGNDVLTPEALAWQREARDQVIVEHGNVLRQVTSIPTLLEFLGRDPTTAQIDAAIRMLPRYLTDSAVTRDRRVALLSFGVDVSDVQGLRTVRDDLVNSLTLPPAGLDAELTGLPVVALHAQELISKDRFLTNTVGIGVAGLVLLVGLARRRDALLAIWSASIATGLGFALLHLSGLALNPVTVSLGALTVAVGCEFCVVQAEAARTGSRSLARAVGIVALTSGVGYLVLLTSGLSAVRTFGGLLACAVGLAAAASWVVVRATVTPGETEQHPADTTDAHALRSQNRGLSHV